jgi:putative addiction module killer protein
MEVRQTAACSDCMARLRDQPARAKIAARIDRLALGNAGDVQPVGDGVSELRIHRRAGYRVHFVKRGKILIVLLCGGDKNTQSKDTKAANLLAASFEN